MKILFTDLDGTLLDDEKRLCDRNRAAIRAMCEAGHKIVYISGRSVDSVMALTEKLLLPTEGAYVVGFNGAQIADAVSGERLYRTGFSFALTASLFRDAHAAGVHPQAYDDKRVVAERDTEALRRYCRVIGMDSIVVEDAAAYLEEIQVESSKILVIDYDDHARLDAFRERMLSAYGDELDSFYSNPSFCEAVPKGVNKGHAVERLCEILEVPLSDAVGAGDEMNDIPLIKTSGTGCALRNAIAAAKDAADYVTEADNNEGGVAEIIERFIL